jgi:hypothetical protein
MEGSGKAGGPQERVLRSRETDWDLAYDELQEDVAPAPHKADVAAVRSDDWVAITKWKVRVTLLFLAAMNLLSLVTVALTPVVEVRIIAAAVLTSSVIAAGRVLGLGSSRKRKNPI